MDSWREADRPSNWCFPSWWRTRRRNAMKISNQRLQPNMKFYPRTLILIQVLFLWLDSDKMTTYNSQTYCWMNDKPTLITLLWFLLLQCNYTIDYCIGASCSYRTFPFRSLLTTMSCSLNTKPFLTWSRRFWEGLRILPQKARPWVSSRLI